MLATNLIQTSRLIYYAHSLLVFMLLLGNTHATSIWCNSTITNGDETDLNCGGTTCTQRCESGQKCVNSTDCVLGLTCTDSLICGNQETHTNIWFILGISILCSMCVIGYAAVYVHDYFYETVHGRQLETRTSINQREVEFSLQNSSRENKIKTRSSGTPDEVILEVGLNNTGTQNNFVEYRDDEEKEKGNKKIDENKKLPPETTERKEEQKDMREDEVNSNDVTSGLIKSPGDSYSPSSPSPAINK